MLEDRVDMQGLFDSYSTLKTRQELRRLLLSCGKDQIFGDPRDIVNSLFFANCKNERVVKAALVDKVLLRHSGFNVAAFEVPVGNSRVDVCEFGRNSTGYEIKTEYDSFVRLKTQISDYLDVFDYTYLIVPRGALSEAELSVPQECGIMTYSTHRASLSFDVKRRASYRAIKDSFKQLDSLSRTDLESLIGVAKGEALENAKGKVMGRKSAKRVNALFRSAMRERYRKRWIFLRSHIDGIYPIDYEWFFSNNIEPSEIYQ